jgi:hypothetical protein
MVFDRLIPGAERDTSKIDTGGAQKRHAPLIAIFHVFFRDFAVTMTIVRENGQCSAGTCSSQR